MRRIYLGASIAPFRALEGPTLSVIPWSNGALLEGTDSALDEYPGLAAWWRKARKEIWGEKRSDSTRLSSKSNSTTTGNCRGSSLSSRIVWSTRSRATASRPAGSTTVERSSTTHSIGQQFIRSRGGQLPSAILNSDVVHEKVEPLMSEGLFGKRHIDKYVFAVPFPILRTELRIAHDPSSARGWAEKVAAGVQLAEIAGFQKARRLVREVLVTDGVADQIEERVNDLLGPVAIGIP